MTSFAARLRSRAHEVDSWLCLGLDPDPSKFPDGMQAEDVREWCHGVLDAASDLAAAVKPNAAFFEALGPDGEDAMASVCERLRGKVPIVLDGKRNDIGNTASKYAEAAFDLLGVDAVTVTPYLGRDTVEPFARYEDKGVFLLARTSNPSAGDFQDLELATGERFYQAVARKAMEDWQPEFRNLGFVAGATYTKELADLRSLCGSEVPLLIPGVGAQGADAKTTLAAGANSDGDMALINVGRAILYPTKGVDWKDQVVAQARVFAADL